MTKTSKKKPSDKTGVMAALHPEPKPADAGKAGAKTGTKTGSKGAAGRKG